MIDEELHFLLMKCFQASHNRIVKEIKKIGLLSGQPKILEYLLENDGAKSVDIAQYCSLDKSTVAGILARMENMNLITRESDKTDTRSKKINLTDHGRQKAFQVKQICSEVDTVGLKGIEAEQKKLFYALNKVIENLEE